MSINDAEPGDIYIDDNKKLWRVVGVCREPTVTVEEVEGHTYAPAPYGYGQLAAQNVAAAPQAPAIIRDRKTGGLSGLMWQGFKLIWRKEPA